MNLLIIGGLMAFALVAILAAVLLGMSEQRAEKARASSAAQGTASPAEAGKEATEKSETDLQTIPVIVGNGTRISANEQTLPALNGQFREFASELRSLHQQAWELEQRLRGLTELVERIEDARNNHVDVEEDTHMHTQADKL